MDHGRNGLTRDHWHSPANWLPLMWFARKCIERKVSQETKVFQPMLPLSAQNEGLPPRNQRASPKFARKTLLIWVRGGQHPMQIPLVFRAILLLSSMRLSSLMFHGAKPNKRRRCAQSGKLSQFSQGGDKNYGMYVFFAPKLGLAESS